MRDIAAKVEDAIRVVRERWSSVPRAGIILGSGLGGFADCIEAAVTIPYGEIPHFPKSTAIGHAGELVAGTVDGLPVVTMRGRFHGYEGHSMADITLPVRVMKALGIELLVVSNAAGGLNPTFQVGDLMLIDDHIHWMFDNPLFGVNDDDLGPRFPDMSHPYDQQLIEVGLSTARRMGFVLHRGVYLALSGPTYETRAEMRMLRWMGADAVGMSTVPEVLVARHAGLRAAAISVITNVCKPDILTPTHGEEVVEVAATAGDRMEQLVRAFLAHVA